MKSLVDNIYEQQIGTKNRAGDFLENTCFSKPLNFEIVANAFVHLKRDSPQFRPVFRNKILPLNINLALGK